MTGPLTATELNQSQKLWTTATSKRSSSTNLPTFSQSAVGRSIPSKNRLARNMQILQVFFLQDLQDLALNLASLALKMKLFLQDIKNLARILQEKIVK